MDKKWIYYDFIDILKCISIFFVIFYHSYMVNTNILSNELTPYFHYFVETIFTIGVPVFFLVNGFLLLGRELDLKRHLRKMINICIIVIFWHIICVFLSIFIKSNPLTLKSFIVEVWNADYLWFLQALFIVYVFVPLIKIAFDGNKVVFYYFLCVAMIFSFGNELLGMLANVFEFLIGKNFLAYSFNFFNDFNPFRGIYGFPIVYFMIGGLIFRKVEEINSSANKMRIVIIGIVSWILLFLYGILMSFSDLKVYDIVFQGYDKVFALIMSVAIFLLLLNYKTTKGTCKVCSIIGKNTLGIYCIQWPVVALGKRVFGSIYGSNIIFNAIAAIIMLFICVGIVLLIKKIPILRKTVTM